MKQSAAALAAVLTPPGAGSSSLEATSPTAEQCPGQCQQHEQAECDTAEALASQVVQLMQQLIVQRSAACLDVTGTSTGSSQTSAAATVMLQQLSTFPSTAVLLCVAVAQGLQQHVQLLKDSSAVIMSIKPANLGSATAAGEEALLAASQALEASYELLTDLVSIQFTSVSHQQCCNLSLLHHTASTHNISTTVVQEVPAHMP
jgi:hypothetical protein